MEVKCKACDGAGTSNWCVNGTFKTCDVCGGTGHVEYPMMSMNGDEYTGEWERHECEECNGTGKEQTNEEWFDNLPTIEKAKIMIRLVNNLEKRELIAEWLKAVHNAESMEESNTDTARI